MRRPLDRHNSRSVDTRAIRNGWIEDYSELSPAGPPLCGGLSFGPLRV
jgi:hypothetical protein